MPWRRARILHPGTMGVHGSRPMTPSGQAALVAPCGSRAQPSGSKATGLSFASASAFPPGRHRIGLVSAVQALALTCTMCKASRPSLYHGTLTRTQNMSTPASDARSRQSSRAMPSAMESSMLCRMTNEMGLAGTIIRSRPTSPELARRGSARANNCPP